MLAPVIWQVWTALKSYVFTWGYHSFLNYAMKTNIDFSKNVIQVVNVV